MKQSSVASSSMKVDPQRIYLATGNAHKVQEFQQLAEASGLAIEFVPPPTMPTVVEDSGTFRGNARKKASALKSTLPPDAWVLADDSGLCVDALGGLPGVESAYYAGREGNGKANLEKLVQVMRGVPPDKRHATFVCVLLLLRGANATDLFFEGVCEGRLRETPSGAQGFGYDPLFIPLSYQHTFADLGDGIKQAVSHRGRAFGALVHWLKSIPAGGLSC